MESQKKIRTFLPVMVWIVKGKHCIVCYGDPLHIQAKYSRLWVSHLPCRRILCTGELLQPQRSED